MRSTPATARGDRPVEVGEPVVGQRLAGEVRDLGREVAGRDARPDRDVDEQVAPVPAAADPAVRGLVPAVAEQDDARRSRRPRLPGTRPGHRPRWRDDPVARRPAERCQPAVAHAGDDQGRDREQDRADDDRLATEARRPERRHRRGGPRGRCWSRSLRRPRPGSAGPGRRAGRRPSPGRRTGSARSARSRSAAPPRRRARRPRWRRGSRRPRRSTAARRSSRVTGGASAGRRQAGSARHPSTAGGSTAGR